MYLLHCTLYTGERTKSAYRFYSGGNKDSLRKGCNAFIGIIKLWIQSNFELSLVNFLPFRPLQGVKEVILLGQNVNSYRDLSHIEGFEGFDQKKITNTSKDFKTVYKPKTGGRRFSTLLDKVSLVDPEMRIRFTSPHPKDFPDEVNYISTLHLYLAIYFSLPLVAQRVFQLLRRIDN